MNFDICKKCEHFQCVPNKKDYFRFRCTKHYDFNRRSTIGHMSLPSGFKNSLPEGYQVLIRDGKDDDAPEAINNLPKIFWQDWATMCKNLNEKNVQLSDRFQMPTDCPFKLEHVLLNQKL